MNRANQTADADPQSVRISMDTKAVINLGPYSRGGFGQEVETAFEREQTEMPPIILPIRLDDAVESVKEGWAADIRRTRNIGDFTNWQDDRTYNEAFARLLSNLKTDPGR